MSKDPIRPASQPPSSSPPPPSTPAVPERPPGLSRRGFIGRAGVTAGVAAAGVGPLLPGTAEAAVLTPDAPFQRRVEFLKVRGEAAAFEARQPLLHARGNGDDERYPNRIASFTKGLPHDARGIVVPSAYAALLTALRTGRPEDFDAIPLGTPGPTGRKLVNPQGALAFEVFGPDSHQIGIRPAPAFASAETAGEMVELYWHALSRDVPFVDYGTDETIAAATAELSRLSDFRGPRSPGAGGRVMLDQLFRMDLPGALTGPYVSQFLWRDIAYGPFNFKQQIRTVVPNLDYVTTETDWLAILNGLNPPGNTFDPQLRYVRSGRDLGQYFHIDFVYEAYLNALLILVGLRAPVDANNPYRTSTNQQGNAVFGNPHVASLLGAVSTRAIKAAWFHKWHVNRRLRPETMGGRIHQTLTDVARYPIHADVLSSEAVARVRTRNGTFFLPQAYPEGSPVHPAYPGGHAVLAGACVTILKAFFDESFVIPDPVVASRDGLTLDRYTGAPLTVGGELNKLAMNAAKGRDWAGIHYRSDSIESLKLGEEVAIRLLREDKLTYNEPFKGFSLTRFDGTTITV
jgi:hypothetical protein